MWIKRQTESGELRFVRKDSVENVGSKEAQNLGDEAVRYYPGREWIGSNLEEGFGLHYLNFTSFLSPRSICIASPVTSQKIILYPVVKPYGANPC